MRGIYGKISIDYPGFEAGTIGQLEVGVSVTEEGTYWVGYLVDNPYVPNNWFLPFASLEVYCFPDQINYFSFGVVAPDYDGNIAGEFKISFAQSAWELIFNPLDLETVTIIADRPQGISDEDAEILAREYMPVLKLGKYNDTAEYFQPKEVDIMLNEAKLSDSSEYYPLSIDYPSASDLYSYPYSSLYLDLTCEDPAARYQEIAESCTTQIYYTVTSETYDETDYLCIQYWFFYFFNDWADKIWREGEDYTGFNNHEGDWEMITVLINQDTYIPEKVGFSQHKRFSKWAITGGELVEWGDVEVIEETNHPVVYVAIGSHASFHEEGFYQYKVQWGHYVDVYPGNALWLVPDKIYDSVESPYEEGTERLYLERLPRLDTTFSETSPNSWLRFSGIFGQYDWGGETLPGFDGPSSGPFCEFGWYDDSDAYRWVNPASWVHALEFFSQSRTASEHKDYFDIN